MSTTEYAAVVDTGFARLGIVADEVLEKIDFVLPDTPVVAPVNDLAREVCRQLAAYETSADFRFSLPLEQRGTEFQLAVWTALREIPVGEVLSYGQLASELGSAARAVGGACRRNPIPIITPCHRVVAAHSLGGFSGQAEQGEGRGLIDIKRRLLRHEGVFADRA